MRTLATEKQVPMILDFLQDIANNNNRPWFQAHREEYDRVRQAFESITAQLIMRLGDIDE